ncbi:MAG: hypothetical protein Q9227_000269 [Pyrenula ochraceoflavens]
MAERPRSTSNASLEVPRRSTEIEDSGAHDLDSSDEHFSDAPEGQNPVSPPPPQQSPVPRTRVEKIDDAPSHGQVPGSPAYNMRKEDAVPDEVEIIPEGRSSNRNSMVDGSRTPGGTLVPRTVVEKVDPSSPSHGEIPGTEAYEKRMADAAPDIVLRAPEPGNMPPALSNPGPTAASETPIPETIISRVDSNPAHGEQPGTKAYDMRTRDATPDAVEKVDDVSGPLTGSGSPTSSNHRSHNRTRSRRKSSLMDSRNPNSDPEELATGGDDFDDFEEGEEIGSEDDFGDFGDDYEAPTEDDHKIPTQPSIEPKLLLHRFRHYKSANGIKPLIDFSSISSLQELTTAMEDHLDHMFPQTRNLSEYPKPEPLGSSSPLFPTDRSRSLWTQLITPPPLQPPNWTKSRIRRLFLVSLGVPVDLDEILPPSKQKKLVLPDINLEAPSRKSESDKTLGSVARLKQKAANDSNASVDSTQSASQSSRRRGGRKGPAPPPELDLADVRRLCATTDEKLDRFEDGEMKAHIAKLEEASNKTNELLEYWVKRLDLTRSEKEAFEGVIENLVKHARRVRK